MDRAEERAVQTACRQRLLRGSGELVGLGEVDRSFLSRREGDPDLSQLSVFDPGEHRNAFPFDSPPELSSGPPRLDRKSTRLNSSHDQISYAVFCLKKKKQPDMHHVNYFRCHK